MRILEVMAGAADGGAETAFADSCIAMAATGAEVAVVTRPNNKARIERLKQAGLTVYTLPFGGAPDLYTRWALRRIIRNFRPQIVQTWMARAAQKTPAWRPSESTPRYYVFSRLGGYYKLKNFKSTDYFTTITPDIRDWLIRQGVDPERVRHINNFAETEACDAPADRAREDTPADAKLLVALGRLHKAKAFDILLQAMAELPGVYLWIAGEGPERGVLKSQIVSLGLADRVRLLGWRNDRAALLQAADLCVFPSRYEPFGTVFVQAWEQRVSLVTTNADGPRQFVRDGEDGLVVPVEDSVALAQAIRRVLSDQALASRLVERGYARYINEFTRDSNIKSYLDFYRYALDSRNF